MFMILSTHIPTGEQQLFNSNKEAAAMLGLDYFQICKVVQGKIKYTGDYTFCKFVENNVNNEETEWVKNIDICQYNNQYLDSLFSVYAKQFNKVKNARNIALFSKILKETFCNLEIKKEVEQGKAKIKVNSQNLCLLYEINGIIWNKIIDSFNRQVRESIKVEPEIIPSIQEKYKCTFTLSNFKYENALIVKGDFSYFNTQYEKINPNVDLYYQQRVAVIDNIFNIYYKNFQQQDLMVSPKQYVDLLHRKDIKNKSSKEIYFKYCNYVGIEYNEKKGEQFSKIIIQKFGKPTRKTINGKTVKLF
jgi:hypothetical protein